MVTIPELKHNRFKEVDVPSPAKLYNKYGFGIGTRKESGEEYLDPSLSKVEIAREVSAEVKKLDAAAAAVESES